MKRRLTELQLRRLIRHIMIENDWEPGTVITGRARATTQDDINALSYNFKEFDRLARVLRDTFGRGLSDQKIHDIIMGIKREVSEN